jgi:hypothetical protein
LEYFQGVQAGNHFPVSGYDLFAPFGIFVTNTGTRDKESDAAGNILLA